MKIYFDLDFNEYKLNMDYDRYKKVEKIIEAVIKKVRHTHLPLSYIPTVDMIFDLLDFTQFYDFTKKELDVIYNGDDCLFKIYEVRMYPNYFIISAK